MFDAKKKTLDEVAMLVLVLVERTLFGPVGARRNNGDGAHLPNVCNQSVGIVGLVRDHYIRMHPVEQRDGLAAVVNLPPRSTSSA